MELVVKEVVLPETFEFNYEELKTQLTERVSEYETAVYTEELIKQAKADRSSLNKLKKALNDERIRREREYLAPFQDFKSKIAELCGIIDKASNCVDAQVKAYEQKIKDEKQAQIVELFGNVNVYEWLKLEQIFDSKWLNNSVSLKKVEDEIADIMKQIRNDLQAIDIGITDYNFEAAEVYKRTLNICDAMGMAERMRAAAQARKEREEQQRLKNAEIKDEKNFVEEVDKTSTKMPENGNIVDETDTEAREWVKFSALLSVREAKMLATFCRANNIEIKSI